MEDTEMELRCAHCSSVERCGLSQMLPRLQAVGVLRRTRDPELAMVVELFTASAGRFACGQCGRTGLTCHAASDDEWDAWKPVKHCESCRQPISPERLEIFPDASLCPACQRKEESGSLVEVEYCPRCGDAMTMRLERRGTSRYIMSCPSCGVRT